ncbi:MAG: hypothetical protein JWO80_1888 [Bryobacterales bacterium]|nr:hypothetical protein [Bryobacterales bacterium]
MDAKTQIRRSGLLLHSGSLLAGAAVPGDTALCKVLPHAVVSVVGLMYLNASAHESSPLDSLRHTCFLLRVNG